LRCCLLQKAGVELVAGVRAGLKQRMMDVDWLDDETRKLSIEKVTPMCCKSYSIANRFREK
jgi:predicted metalloendopeptidase